MTKRKICVVTRMDIRKYKNMKKSCEADSILINQKKKGNQL